MSALTRLTVELTEEEKNTIRAVGDAKGWTLQKTVIRSVRSLIANDPELVDLRDDAKRPDRITS